MTDATVVQKPVKQKKKLFLKLSLPCSVLAARGVVSLPVQYGRLVSLRGAKAIVVVCREYDLPATYSLLPNKTALWEGYCSDGMPALKKLVKNGAVIPKSKLRHLLEGSCFNVNNQVNPRLAGKR